MPTSESSQVFRTHRPQICIDERASNLNFPLIVVLVFNGLDLSAFLRNILYIAAHCYVLPPSTCSRATPNPDYKQCVPPQPTGLRVRSLPERPNCRTRDPLAIVNRTGMYCSCEHLHAPVVFCCDDNAVGSITYNPPSAMIVCTGLCREYSTCACPLACPREISSGANKHVYTRYFHKNDELCTRNKNNN